jgi:hypothetical protein
MPLGTQFPQSGTGHNRQIRAWIKKWLKKTCCIFEKMVVWYRHYQRRSP